MFAAFLNSIIPLKKHALPKKNGGLGGNVLYLTIGKNVSNRRLNDILKYLAKDVKPGYLNTKIHFKHLDRADFELLMSNINEYLIPNNIKMIVIDDFPAMTNEFIDEESGDVDYLSKNDFIKTYLTPKLVTF